MGNLLFKLRVVGFICFSLITILWPFAVFANQINVDNWSIEVIAQRASESVPAYSRPNDSEKSGSIIGVSKNQYIEGLSSIVLIKREDGEAFGFVAGNLSSPGNNLIIVEIKVHNLVVHFINCVTYSHRQIMFLVFRSKTKDSQFLKFEKLLVHVV